MKRFLLFALIITLAAGLLWVLSPGPKPSEAKEQFVPGEALVKFKSEVADERVNALLQNLGATVKKRIDPQQVYVIGFPETIAPHEMVGRLKALPEVSIVEPNGIYEPLIGFDLLWPREASAEETRTTLGAGSKVTVAVIDTAIDANHSVLAGKTVTGYNVLNGSTNTQSTGAGVDWHGTASSGRVLEGAGDANVQIMPIQVFGPSGSTSWSNVIEAINKAVDSGVQVINMSLGGFGRSEFLQQAIDRATEKGILVVASAGNWNTERPAFPASYNGVISVAATNNDGKKASFSNFGSTVDISAPGDRLKLLNHGGGYRIASGTSFSGPFIAGMLAMMRSAFPFLTCNQLERIMKEKANDHTKSNADKMKGKLGAGFLGSLDVKKWMEQIKNGSFLPAWLRGPQPVTPVRPPVPPPQPAPTQPWLVKGKGHSGTYILTPAGEVTHEEKKK